MTKNKAKPKRKKKVAAYPQKLTLSLSVKCYKLVEKHAKDNHVSISSVVRHLVMDKFGGE